MENVCLCEKYMYFCFREFRCYIMRNVITSVWRFYIDGFKSMTWGRELWLLILLKVIILFVLLRGFFFQPVLEGKSDTQKMEHVGMQLIEKQNQQNNIAQPN